MFAALAGLIAAVAGGWALWNRRKNRKVKKRPLTPRELCIEINPLRVNREVMAEMTRKQKFQLGIIVAAVAAGGSVLSGAAQAVLSSWLDAPKLRKENATLKEDLVKKSADLQKLETEFIPFKTVAFQSFTGTDAERLAKLALKLNEIQGGLSALSEKHNATAVKTEQLAERFTPRQLTSEQRSRFISATKNAPKAPITIVLSNTAGDTAKFANEVYDLLNEAGFNVGKIEYTLAYTFTLKGPWCLGIILGTRDVARIPSYVFHLEQAFANIGVPIEPLDGRSAIPEGEFKIYVGSR